MMEGHHEVRKSLSLWHLSKKKVGSLVNTLRPKRFSGLKVKMGGGGQDEPAGKSEITLGEKKGGVVSCGPFPILSVVKMPDIQSASRLMIFSAFGLGGKPILN